LEIDVDQRERVDEWDEAQLEHRDPYCGKFDVKEGRTLVASDVSPLIQREEDDG